MKTIEFGVDNLLEKLEKVNFSRKQIGTKDGNKILIRINEKFLYSIGRIHIIGTKIDLKLTKDTENKVGKYREYLTALNLINSTVRSFESGLKDQETLFTELQESFSLVETETPDFGIAYVVYQEFKRDMNLAQLYREGDSIEIKETHEVMNELITQNKLVKALEYRKKLKELESILGKSFVQSVAEPK